MRALFQAIRGDDAVLDTIRCFSQRQGQSLVYGLSGAEKHTVFAAAYAASPRPFVILTHSRDSLELWREDLSFLLPGKIVTEIPTVDEVNFRAAAKSLELATRRMDVLGRLFRREPVIVLALPAAAVQKVMSPEVFRNLRFHLSVGDEFKREEFLPLESMLSKAAAAYHL